MMPRIITSAGVGKTKFPFSQIPPQFPKKTEVAQGPGRTGGAVDWSGVEGLKQNKHFPTYFVCQSQLC